MINHARTLLLNRPATDALVDADLLNEYVDPSFTPIVLTRGMQAYREAWLGSNEEPRFQNLQLRRMEATIRSQCDVETFVSDMDRRNTVDLRYRSTPTSGIVTEFASRNLKVTTYGNPTVNPFGVALVRVMFESNGSVVLCRGNQYAIGKPFPALTWDDQGPQIVVESGTGTGVVKITASDTPDPEVILRNISVIVGKNLSDVVVGAPQWFIDMWMRGRSVMERLAGSLAVYLYQADKIWRAKQ